MRIRSKKAQRGSAIVEFAIACVFLIPVIIGTATLGMGLVRFLQVSSITRSAGSMFVRGADFSLPSFQKLLGKIAAGLGMSDPTTGAIRTSGNGVVTLTELMRIGEAHCGALPAGVDCTNRGKVVIVKQVRVGNKALRASRLGTPGSAPRSDGSYTPNQYLRDSSHVVGVFGTAPDDLLPTAGAPVDLRAGRQAYVSESYFVAPELNLYPQVFEIDGYTDINYF